MDIQFTTIRNYIWSYIECVPLLSRTIRTPLIGSIRIRRIGSISSYPNQVERVKWISRMITRITIVRSLIVRLNYNRIGAGYQIEENYKGRRPRGIGRSRGVDGISVRFVRLTARRTPRSRLASWDGVKKNVIIYYVTFVAIEGRIRAVFLVTDVRWFYVTFEAVLIPIYIRIGIWGGRERKVRAAYRFFLYTLVGSVRRLVCVLYRNSRYGTTDIQTLTHICNRSVEQGGLEKDVERMRWLGVFVAIAVKVPIVPVHVWLPEAHVEAPTGGSVILAGILLKVGTYGIRRRLIGIRPNACRYFTPRVYIFAVIGVVYPARTARRQTDRKRIVAYASVSHINLTIVGIFSRTVQGVVGAVLQIVSHGLVAGARFMVIGVRYDRYHTRRVIYYGGVAHTMPRFSRVFRVFTRANIGLPGTSSFVGEWLIFVGIAQTNRRVTRRCTSGIVLGAAYSLWLYNRVVYGNLKRRYRGVSLDQIQDRTIRERRMFSPLRRGTRWLGRNPNRVLDRVDHSCKSRLFK